jgi:Fur family iron response transcriptional regulator
MNRHASQFPLDRAQVVDLLVSRSITPTAQRVEIAQFLFARAQHISADHILASVNAAGGRVSKATVYNTLGLFVEKGIVREVLIKPERIFYDSNTHPHHHLYNADTGQLSDIDADAITVQGLPDLPSEVELEGVDLVIRVRNRAS